MWKGLGNLKSGLGDITSKTISSVAKAGSRAKEVILLPPSITLLNFSLIVDQSD